VKLTTSRLVLRDWREEDKPLYAAIIADPEVRRYFHQLGTPADAELGIERARARLAELGYSFLAVERREDGAFMGMLGMAPMKESLRLLLPGAPAVEIGWQLGKAFWGHGYASEGAAAMLDFAWRRLALPEVVAVTYEGNSPSRRVMEKLGMTRDPRGDFEHPDVPAGHPLRPHVLYRIANPALRG
jgi:RimJ/RimL family protein N-acetyltransferase